MQQFQPPAEYTIRHATVDATPERCIEVAADVERYPEWVDGVSSAVITERDSEGRPLEVEFVAEAIGRRTRYVLRYDLTEMPNRLSWSLVEGDLTRRLDGAYGFTPSADEPGSTDVTYELAIDLVVPLPGFVKRRAEAKIVQAALPDFRRRVEA